MEKPQKQGLVSVIIPCFNAIKWIGRAIESAAAQTYKHTEIIVVDDGSTDRTAEYVSDRYPFAIILMQKNRGVAAARNLGARAARGECLAFLDADDYWSKVKLEAQFKAVRGFERWGMCVAKGCTFPLDSSPPVLAGEEAGPSQVSLISVERLLRDNIIWTSSVLIRRDAFEAVGGFDEDLRRAEDLDLWLKIARISDIIEIDAVHVGYQVTPGSLSKDICANEAAKWLVLARWKNEYPIVTSLIAKRSMSLARKLLRAGRVDEARTIYMNPDYGRKGPCLRFRFGLYKTLFQVYRLLSKNPPDKV